MSQSVLVLGSDQAPLTYPVGIDGTITVLSAFANVNGHSTVVDYLPCLSFYDSDSNLISRAYGEYREASTAGDLPYSWFADADDPNTGGVREFVSALAPGISLDRGCSIVFEAVTYDGSAVADVFITDALLRAEVTEAAA
jgi:hypothetical protein